MSRHSRNVGCLFFGVFWSALFAMTFLAGVMGDCVDRPGQTGCEAEREAIMHYWMLGELVVLVGVGWLFYRRRMKDGDL